MVTPMTQAQEEWFTQRGQEAHRLKQVEQVKEIPEQQWTWPYPSVNHCDLSGREADVVVMDDVEESEQVGGDHYSRLAIEPIEYIRENKLTYCEGNVVKYLSRYRNKGGLEDLRKAEQYLGWVIEDWMSS